MDMLDLKFENFLLFVTTMLLTPTTGSLSASSVLQEIRKVCRISLYTSYQVIEL